MSPFQAKIEIIGINPFVFLPDETIEALTAQLGKHKGKIPVKVKIDGHEFPQTLVKYAGHWRLYLNLPMRKAAGKDVGDTAVFELELDPSDRSIPMHLKLQLALEENPLAKAKFESLPPSRRNEIVRYIAHLKSEESVERNVARAIGFLQEKERFVGRDNP
jgi:Domain of unknown function (DUF1905)/Bacteriocin-protection, YdeI or OmpD-Associated